MAYVSKIYLLPHEAEPILRRQLIDTLGQVLLQKQGVSVTTDPELIAARIHLIATLRQVNAKRYSEKLRAIIHESIAKMWMPVVPISEQPLDVVRHEEWCFEQMYGK